jgi:putative DNA primase/helicase
MEEMHAGRAAYVAAALTIVRAYLTAGAPKVTGPFGSYAAWSTMVRSPLMWLGEPDPVVSMEEMREEDAELTAIREFFALWPAYMMMSTPLASHPYTVTRMIELACEQKPGNFNSLDLKLFFLQVAQTRGEISPGRLGLWLKRISGRIVDGLRLVKGRDSHTKNSNYCLTNT